MSTPNHAGAFIRIAKALATELVEGEVFHSATFLGERFGVSVADAERRMRDLSDHGWVIQSYRDDPVAIPRGHRRLVRIGEPIWDADVRSPRRNYMSTMTDVEGVPWDQFSLDELRQLRVWFQAGERPETELDRTWRIYRRANERVRARLMTDLLANVGQRTLGDTPEG